MGVCYIAFASERRSNKINPHDHFSEHIEKEEAMLGDSCLICNTFIESIAHAWFPIVNGFPICSQACVDEWNDLSYEDQQRYMQCQNALEALRGE